jgi:tetratricopeptide (TPR) repeat protein
MHPKRLLWALAVFVNDWWWSRPWKRLLYCAPILGVAGLALVVSVWYLFTPTPRISYRYATVANRAIASGDYKTAELYTRKLIALEPANPEYRYSRAQLAAAAKDTDRAWAYMKELAPDDRAGYAKAHLWQAAQMLSGQRERTKEELALARRHLERAVDGLPENIDARGLLVQLYVADQQYEKAALHLAVVAEERPAARLGLARIHAFLGDKELARKEAEAVSVHFAKLLHQNPDDIEARVRLAETYTFLEDYRRAVELLENGLKRKNDDRYRQLLSQVYVIWSDHLPPEAVSERLEYVQRAMDYNPAEYEVLKRMAQFAAKDSPHSQQMRQQLHEVLASGKAQATVHMILGTIGIQDGDLDKALFHLEQAHAQNGQIPAVVNNLAYLLARVDPPQLDRALQLADAAVELAPRSAEIRETRGDIHFRLQNWKQTISDLEIALGVFPDRKSLHEKLAVAYEQLGETELAAQHRKNSERLETDDASPGQ